LRPGTLPVHLIAGLGRAAELAVEESHARLGRCRELRRRIIEGLAPLDPVINGDPERSVAHVINIAFRGIDAETAIGAWSDVVAISPGAACTAHTYTCSHVLSAMGLPHWRQEGALRLSWCHTTPVPDLTAMVATIERARQSSEAVTQ